MMLVVALALGLTCTLGCGVAAANTAPYPAAFDNGTVIALARSVEVAVSGTATGVLAPHETPVGEAVSVLVVRVGFLTNLGYTTLPSCNGPCVLGSLWDNAPRSMQQLLADGSEGALVLDKGASTLVTVNLTLYASSLGCTVDLWADAVIDALAAGPAGIRAADYGVVVYLLPASAGGGSCARFQELAVLNCLAAGTRPCEMWLRNTSLTYWASGFGHVLGRLGTRSLDGSNPFSVPDTWARLIVPDRYELGWLRPQDVAAVDPAAPLLGAHLRSGSLPLPPTDLAIPTLYTLAGPSTPWYLSYRSGGDVDTLDSFLGHPWRNRVYVHHDQSLVGVLAAVGDRYVNYGADFTVQLVRPGNATMAVVDVRHCVQSGGVVTAPVGLGARPGSSVAVTLTFTNRDADCAPSPVSVQCLVGLASGLPLPRKVCNALRVVIVPDINRLEMSYRVVNSAGDVVLSGGYADNATTYCGPVGETLTALFYDGGGDGYCCQYGGGSYWQVRLGGTVIGQGGEFAFLDTFKFQNTATWVFGDVAWGTTTAATTDVIVSTDPGSSVFTCGLIPAKGVRLNSSMSDAAVRIEILTGTASKSRSRSASASTSRSSTSTWSVSRSRSRSRSRTISISSSIYPTQSTLTRSVTRSRSRRVSVTVSASVSVSASKTATRLRSVTTLSRSQTKTLSASRPSKSKTQSRSQSRSRFVSRTSSRSDTVPM